MNRKYFLLHHVLSYSLLFLIGIAPLMSQKTPANLKPEEIEAYKKEAVQLIRFMEYSFNLLGDETTTNKEKDVIITESYLKIFQSDKVEVEDDLDEKREMHINKEVQAYLKDIDFFFKRVRFKFDVQEVVHAVNEQNQLFFIVTLNRNLNGKLLNNDSINSNRVRYVEINLDDEKKELKIASIYTVKLNEAEDLQSWWASLSPDWQLFFGENIRINDSLKMSDIISFGDSTAFTKKGKLKIPDEQLNRNVKQIVSLSEISLANNTIIKNITPLSKLTKLKKIDISNTLINDLTALRNLQQMESLNCSRTSIVSIDPLRFAINLKELNLDTTSVEDLEVLKNLTNLSVLHFENTRISSLTSLSEMQQLVDLRFSGITIASLEPINGLSLIQNLECSDTQIESIEPLKNMKNLRTLHIEKTKVNNLLPISGLPKLENVYCDGSDNIGKNEAINFVRQNPKCKLIFRSRELLDWWNSVSEDWKRALSQNFKMEQTPTKIQLHELVLLDSINISNNKFIRNLDPITKFENLKILYFANTEIKNLLPVSTLSNLKVIVCSKTSVNDLEPVRNLQNLEFLNCENTEVKSLDPLQNLSNLKILNIDNTPVSAKSKDKVEMFIDSKPNCLIIYETADLKIWWQSMSQDWKNLFAKLVPVDNPPCKEQLHLMAKMESVKLENNISDKQKIRDLNPLNQLWRLKELDVSGSGIENLDPIKQLIRIENLNLSETRISSLDALKKFSKLKKLNFESTQLEDLESLSGLKSLEELNCAGTKIKSLKGLEPLSNLIYLDCSKTKIGSVFLGNLQPIEGLKKIQTLKCYNTKLSKGQVEDFKKSHLKCKIDFY
jgi:Leucine-rich repeat (LRR) protein